MGHTPMGRRLKKLRKNPSKLLNTILLSNLLVNILNASLVTKFFWEKFGTDGIAYAIMIETGAILIFGEILPKTLAARFNTRFAAVSCVVLPLFRTVLKPLLYLFELMTRPIIRFTVGLIPSGEEHLKKKEVIGILKKGDTSVLDPVEETILINMLNIQLFAVKNIMNNVDHDLFIEEDAGREELKNRFRRTKSSFLIVYKDDYEEIRGILKSKSLFSPQMEETLEQPFFVPHLKKIRDVIPSLRTNTVALVVDEYGSITGTLTYDDIMDYILQSVNEESDESLHLVMSDNSIIVESSAPVTKVNRLLGISLDDSDAKTMGGYVDNIYGDIPRKGTVIDTDSCKIIVLEADRKKTCRLKIIKKGDE